MNAETQERRNPDRIHWTNAHRITRDHDDYLFIIHAEAHHAAARGQLRRDSHAKQ